MSVENIIKIENLNKIYEDGFHALKDINLAIKKGEIFALLGPNGAGKTTLISTLCGIVNATSGQVHIDGHDIVKNYRECRKMVGLVPQELTTDAFELVKNTVSFSRGLFGKKANPKFIEQTLKDLSLYDKKDNRLMTLSGGMKRRVMIAKALSHEPMVLFLDEPTAGVDVELRKGMWQLVHQLRAKGVTIILTTHYIEEAEEMADRIGVINDGKLVVVEEKEKLMKSLGSKKLILDLNQQLSEIPNGFDNFELSLAQQGKQLCYTYDAKQDTSNVEDFFVKLKTQNISFSDLNTKQSSLEEIFVSLVHKS